MGIADFLFNGSAPPNTQTYGSTSNNLPQWYSDYTQSLISKANALASTPYVPYSGQRIAQNQQLGNAAGQITGQSFSYDPNTGKPVWVSTGQPGIQEQYKSDVGDALTALKGTLGANAAAGMDPYESRYQKDVIDNLVANSNENLNRNLSGISDRFISGGGFGGSRMGEAMGNAVRGSQRDLNTAVANAKQQGFNTALGASQADLARNLTGAQQLGGLAQQANQTRLANAAAAEAIGQSAAAEQQKNLDLAYKDYMDQMYNFPQQQLQNLAGLGSNVKVDTQQTTSNLAPASTYQASPLAQLASVGSAMAGLGSLIS